MNVFMDSEWRWERQDLARVRYSVSSFRVLQEVLFSFKIDWLWKLRSVPLNQYNEQFAYSMCPIRADRKCTWCEPD